MLRHLRILTEILISKGVKDDVRLKDLLPKFDSAWIAELEKSYGKSNEEGSPCWTLNKMLAHSSSRQSDSYNYTHVLDILVPCITPLLEEIDRTREPSTRTTM